MKAWQVASPPTRSYELTLTVRPKYERLNIWLPCPWLHSAGPPVQRSWSQPPWWSHQSRPQTYPLVPSSCSAGSAAPDAGKTRREACDWSVSEAEHASLQLVSLKFSWNSDVRICAVALVFACGRKHDMSLSVSQSVEHYQHLNTSPCCPSPHCSKT